MARFGFAFMGVTHEKLTGVEFIVLWQYFYIRWLDYKFWWLGFKNTSRISVSEISFDSRPALGSHLAESGPAPEVFSVEPNPQPPTVAYTETPREKVNVDTEGNSMYIHE